jgi:hypothetical protein
LKLIPIRTLFFVVLLKGFGFFPKGSKRRRMKRRQRRRPQRKRRTTKRARSDGWMDG